MPFQRDEDELDEDEYRLRRSFGPSFGGGEGRPRGGGEERRRGERDRRGDLKETQCVTVITVSPCPSKSKYHNNVNLYNQC